MNQNPQNMGPVPQNWGNPNPQPMNNMGMQNPNMNYQAPQPYIPWNNGNTQQLPVINPPQVPNWNRPPLSNYAGLPGRIVMNPNEIRPNEVSMDGSISLFPTNDYSCIYAKAWGQDGNIQTVRYIPEVPAPAEASNPEPTDSMFSEVMARLDNIEQMISRFSVNQDSNKRPNPNYKQNNQNDSKQQYQSNQKKEDNVQ